MKSLVEKYIKNYLNYSNYLYYTKITNNFIDFSLKENLPVIRDVIYLSRIKSNIDEFDVSEEEGRFLRIKPKSLKAFLKLEFDVSNLSDKDVFVEVGEKIYEFKDNEIYVNGNKIDIIFELKDLSGLKDCFDVLFRLLSDEFKVNYEYIDSELGEDFVRVKCSLSELQNNKMFNIINSYFTVINREEYVDIYLKK